MSPHGYLAQAPGRVAWLEWAPGSRATSGSITTVELRPDTPLYVRTSTIRFSGSMNHGRGVLVPQAGTDAWPVVSGDGGLSIRWSESGVERTDTFAPAGWTAYDGATQELAQVVGRAQAAARGQVVQAAASAHAGEVADRAAARAAVQQARLAKVFADRAHAAAMRAAAAHAAAMRAAAEHAARERQAARDAAAHDATSTTSPPPATSSTGVVPPSVPPSPPSTSTTAASPPPEGSSAP